MTAFARLLWREARQAAPGLALLTLTLLLWYGLLRSRVGEWREAALFPLAGLPLGMLPAWTLWRLVSGLRQDYAGPQALLLLALPVSGRQLVAAKLLVAGAEALVGLALAVGGLLLVVASLLPVPEGATVDDVTLLLREVMAPHLPGNLVPALLFVAAGLVLVHFAWVAGRVFPRGRGPAAVLSFLAGGWLLARAGVVAAALLPPLPWAALRTLRFSPWEGTAEWDVVLLDAAPLLGFALATLGLFLLTGWLVERQLEP